MSRTQSITFAGRSFWAYDVALGVLLKHMIDIAENSVASSHSTWLTEQAAIWREIAAVGCYGLEISKEWNQDQINCFAEVVQSACRAMSARQSISAEEVVTWPILEDFHLHTRGATEIRTAPIVELGQAIVSLLAGSLPSAPLDTWWYFGLPEGRTTLEMRVSEWHDNEKIRMEDKDTHT